MTTLDNNWILHMGFEGLRNSTGRPTWDTNQECEQPEVRFNDLTDCETPFPCVERLDDQFGWHITALGLDRDRCFASEVQE